MENQTTKGFFIEQMEVKSLRVIDDANISYAEGEIVIKITSTGNLSMFVENGKLNEDIQTQIALNLLNHKIPIY